MQATQLKRCPLDSTLSPRCGFAIVKPGHRLGSRCFAELASVDAATLRRYRALQEPTEQSNVEGWLVSPEQQKVFQFKPEAVTAHSQLMTVPS